MHLARKNNHVKIEKLLKEFACSEIEPMAKIMMHSARRQRFVDVDIVFASGDEDDGDDGGDDEGDHTESPSSPVSSNT